MKGIQPEMAEEKCREDGVHVAQAQNAVLEVEELGGIVGTVGKTGLMRVERAYFELDWSKTGPEKTLAR